MNLERTATLYAMNQSISAAIPGIPKAAAELSEAVEILSGTDPAFSIIWLHGLGADGHDFEPIIPFLGLQDAPDVRFVFPHAPVRPVTLNGGMPMRAWYDIRALGASRDLDEQGIAHSADLVHALVEREISRGVPASNIILAGFSQGGAVAMHVALRFPRPLAGLITLSSYLLFPERLAEERCDANHNMPTFVGHGTMDPTVPFMLGQACVDALKSLSYPVTWRCYPIQHSISQEEISDIGHWIRSRLA